MKGPSDLKHLAPFCVQQTFKILSLHSFCVKYFSRSLPQILLMVFINCTIQVYAQKLLSFNDVTDKFSSNQLQVDRANLIDLSCDFQVIKQVFPLITFVSNQLALQTTFYLYFPFNHVHLVVSNFRHYQLFVLF